VTANGGFEAFATTDAGRLYMQLILWPIAPMHIQRGCVETGLWLECNLVHRIRVPRPL